MDLKAELVRQLQYLDLDVPLGRFDRLILLVNELLRWNRRINLTAVTDPSEAVEKHLVDSLTLLPLMDPAARILDIGSGGGFPCIPLKIARPDLRVVSVEASRKKANFQRHIARSFGLENFQALHTRVVSGDDPSSLGEFDVVVSRAFSNLANFIRLSRPYLATGARLIAMKGPEGEKEVEECLPLLSKHHLGEPEIHRLVLPASGASRIIVVFTGME